MACAITSPHISPTQALPLLELVMLVLIFVYPYFVVVTPFVLDNP